jgi:hypothetical protein
MPARSRRLAVSANVGGLSPVQKHFGLATAAQRDALNFTGRQDEIVFGRFGQRRFHESSPNARRDVAAVAFGHAPVVVVTNPNRGYEIRRVTDEPGIAKVRRRAGFARRRTADIRVRKSGSVRNDRLEQ